MSTDTIAIEQLAHGETWQPTERSSTTTCDESRAEVVCLVFSAKRAAQRREPVGVGNLARKPAREDPFSAAATRPAQRRHWHISVSEHREAARAFREDPRGLSPL